MKRTAISGAAIALIAASVTVAGCGSSPSSINAASNPSASASATTTAKPQSKVAPRITADGPNPTIAGYFKDNHITATPVHKGDPGAPTINFPIPDGWADAGPDTPPTAYWAIIDNGPEAAKYTPSIVATVSKLDGDVDPQKLIELAAGATKNLPGFAPHGDGAEDNLGGFPAYQLGGTWTQNGQTKAVDALPDQVEKALPATITIDEKTTITP
jgi:hypothetical protein